MKESAASASRIEQTVGKLAAAGLRPNGTRIGLLLHMMEQRELVTVDELYARHVPGLPRSISVYYRVLAELARAGLLRSARVGAGRTVAYTSCDHGVGCIAVCVRCRSTSVLSFEAFEAPLRTLARESGIDLMPGPYYLPGLCDRCRVRAGAKRGRPAVGPGHDLAG